MLIVEGFDNTGKTTVVKDLSEEFGLEITKSPGPKPYRKLFAFSDHYLTMMEAIRNDKKEMKDYPIIHDRFPMFSDQVYNRILRNLNPFNDLNEGQWLMSRLIWVSPLVIYCRPTTQTIIKFEDDREQMAGVKDHALTLLAKYDELMLYWERRTGRPLLRYSFETDKIEDLIEKVRSAGW